MLHLAQSKPQIPRTKRFQIVYVRNSTVTSNFFRASARRLTLTISIAQDRIAHNSTMCVAVTLHPSNSPRSQNLNSLERNIPSATRRGSRDATSNFYSSAFLKSVASSLSPTHVRVLSEYSYTPNQTNHDFLEQNYSSDPCRRKSTLTRKKCAQSKQPNRSESRSNKPNVEKRNPCFGSTKIASQYRSHSMGNSREHTLPRQIPETVDFSTHRPCLFPFRGKVSATQKKILPLLPGRQLLCCQGTSQTFNPSVQRGAKASVRNPADNRWG